jgi:hypothetical protein
MRQRVRSKRFAGRWEESCCSPVTTYLPKTLQQPANILDAWSEVMMTQIAPMLAVSDGNAAIDFYNAAFSAQLLWHLGGGGDVVAPGQL